jgi:hypothetical protein
MTSAEAYDAIGRGYPATPNRPAIGGCASCPRVARHRVVLFNADPAQAERFWLTTDYLPGFLDLIPEPYGSPGHWEAELARELGEVRALPVPSRTTARTASTEPSGADRRRT